MSFVELCGQDSANRRAACAALLRQIESTGLEQIRLAWCDQHGQLRGKTLTPRAVPRALQDGIGMVSTILLKDTSDRTVYKVFEEGGVADLAGFEAAGNLVLLPDPASFKVLPWAHKTGWLQCQPWFQNGEPVALDTRRLLQQALQKLEQSGFTMACGLEVEFHIYKIAEDGWSRALDPEQAAWPGLPPALQMIHPGYNLLSESWSDMSAVPLRIVQDTADALGLPLTSLEIELGPSQVEAVFDVTDALTAADNMALFRNGVAQALRRAGYHASFMCRPPFPNIMSSGWHLHQSLVDCATGGNAFSRERPEDGLTPNDAEFTLSKTGAHWLAGLLAHAPAMAALTVPTINGFERFRPNAMAPHSIMWGRDNRSAMLRVVGAAAPTCDAATRIENRLGEPAANPYLTIASQIHAGLDGLHRQLVAPPALASTPLPATLDEALEALRTDTTYEAGFGRLFTDYFCRVKRSEIERHPLAEDKVDWQKREYFSRI
jgi:glutamine synthetase